MPKAAQKLFIIMSEEIREKRERKAFHSYLRIRLDIVEHLKLFQFTCSICLCIRIFPFAAFAGVAVAARLCWCKRSDKTKRKNLSAMISDEILVHLFSFFCCSFILVFCSSFFLEFLVSLHRDEYTLRYFSRFTI